MRRARRFDPSRMKRRANEKKAAKIVARVIAALPATCTLYYTYQGDDGLSDEQIARIFDGDVEGVEEELEEFGDEHIQSNVSHVIAEHTTAEERRLLFPDGLNTLREVILERDDSKGPLLEQLGVTTRKLMRYHLGLTLDASDQWEDEEIEAAMAKIAEAAGIDLAANREPLWHLVVEASYGGDLDVIWYDEPEEVVRACCDKQWGNDEKVPTTIAWTNPHLVVINTMNGSGYSDDVVGTVTKPFDPDNLRMDGQARGHGYTWDQTAGVHGPAFRCDTTLSGGKAT